MSEVSGGAPSAPSSAPAAAPQAQANQSSAPVSTPDSDLSADDLAVLSGESDSSATAGEKAVQNAEKQVSKAQTPEQKRQAREQLEKTKRKYKIKVDGIEEEVEYNDDDVKRDIQLARKAQKEIQQSSELKKELAAFVKQLQTDPGSILSDPALGVDLYKLAQDVMNKRMEDEMKDPLALKAEQLEKELEELRNKSKQDEETRKSLEYERAVKNAEADLEEKVQEALETSGLPKSPYVLKRMAEVMLVAIDKGMNISPKQAMAQVKKEMHVDIKDLFSASPEDLLEELIGQDNIKKLSKRRLSQMRSSTSAANAVKESGIKAQDLKNQNQPKKISINEWLRKK